MYTDSHFHLDSFFRRNEHEALLQRALDAGLSKMVAIGGSDAANALAAEQAALHPDTLYATAGYDRDLCQDWDKSLSKLRPLLAQDEVVAVGECGIDYFHKENPPEAQKELFAAMLELALEFGKPVIVHSREADADTLAMLKPFSERWTQDRPCAVLHCFTGGIDFARELLDMNLVISMSGIVTFKRSEALREVAKQLPLERLLIETDSPYLAPVPYRGKTNEPGFVPQVAKCLAELFEKAPEEIGEITSRNAASFFGWA